MPRCVDNSNIDAEANVSKTNMFAGRDFLQTRVSEDISGRATVIL